jgi:hypothetical protein
MAMTTRRVLDLAVSCCLAAVTFYCHDAKAEDQLTGCLRNGRLVQLQLGDEPLRSECPRGSEQVTIGASAFETPFSVAMIVGDPDIVVGKNGPLEVVARCFPSPASGLPRSRLLIRSDVDGWAITQAIDPTRFNLFDLPAGEQAIGGITNSGPELGGAFGGSALAPTGEVLTVDGGSTLVAMNIHPDYDCVMTGVVTILNVGD